MTDLTRYRLTSEMLDRITEELPDEAIDGLTRDNSLQQIADAWQESTGDGVYAKIELARTMPELVDLLDALVEGNEE